MTNEPDDDERGDDEPGTARSSLFAEEWQQVVQVGMVSFTVTCPAGAELGRACDDPDCSICRGVIKLEGGTLDLGCGCGFHVSTSDGDGMTNVEAKAAFDAHECPLRGVELSVEDMLGIVNDPGGRRRAHAANIANTVDAEGFAVQGVFPTDDEGVWFAYTIGLWPRFGGEILMRGFGEDTPGVVGLMAERIVAGLLPVAEGVHQFAPDDPVALVRFDPWRGDPHDFGQAIVHHGTEVFPRWHVVVADDDGRLPGDPGCEVATYQMKGLPSDG